MEEEVGEEATTAAAEGAVACPVQDPRAPCRGPSVPLKRAAAAPPNSSCCFSRQVQCQDTAAMANSRATPAYVPQRWASGHPRGAQQEYCGTGMYTVYIYMCGTDMFVPGWSIRPWSSHIMI